MPKALTDNDWNLLLRRIRDGNCTPFLGAGASAGSLPVASEIARQWATEYDYPVVNTAEAPDLALVAQFMAVRFDPVFPKERLLEQFSKVAPPDASARDDPHGVLADLPLPLYVTTNYDGYMAHALSQRKKQPLREFCRWNKSLRSYPAVFEGKGRTTTVDKPLVYHLHGYDECPESLVLTEDDYLDFLTSLAQDQYLVPPFLQAALTRSSLLFVGYRLADSSFRVLLRMLLKKFDGGLQRTNVSIQLPPVPRDAPPHTAEAVEQYLDAYFARMNVRVHWGDARAFCLELRQRWEAFSG